MFLIVIVIILNFSSVGKTISKASSDKSVNYSNAVSESRKIININKDWNFDSCDESDDGWDFPTGANQAKLICRIHGNILIQRNLILLI